MRLEQIYKHELYGLTTEEVEVMSQLEFVNSKFSQQATHRKHIQGFSDQIREEIRRIEALAADKPWLKGWIKKLTIEMWKDLYDQEVFIPVAGEGAKKQGKQDFYLPQEDVWFAAGDELVNLLSEEDLMKVGNNKQAITFLGPRSDDRGQRAFAHVVVKVGMVERNKLTRKIFRVEIDRDLNSKKQEQGFSQPQENEGNIFTPIYLLISGTSVTAPEQNFAMQEIVQIKGMDCGSLMSDFGCHLEDWKTLLLEFLDEYENKNYKITWNWKTTGGPVPTEFSQGLASTIWTKAIPRELAKFTINKYLYRYLDEERQRNIFGDVLFNFKRCPKCGENKLLIVNNYSQKKDGKWESWCKPCKNIASKKSRGMI